ncbi:MAG: DUF488 domain-containing protein [Dehalococcoidia bacterium]|nr:DUF488 domain-containing protein [Dehalococcoidia bacterium]
MPHPIYAFGYTGRQLDAVVDNIVAADAVLVDIRFTPRSRVPTWNRKALETRLGERYRWAGDTLGNRLYKSDTIEIVDLAAGLDLIAEISEQHPVALMCVCASPVGCHRETIVTALAGSGRQVSDELLS